LRSRRRYQSSLVPQRPSSIEAEIKGDSKAPDPLPPLHRNELTGDDLELFGGLLDSLALVAGLDLAKPCLLGSDLVDSPGGRSRWYRFLRSKYRPPTKYVQR
jgi:hypothetical protein